jgi:trimeric autotransporter adhesin
MSLHRGVRAETCRVDVRATRPHTKPAQAVIPDVEYFLYKRLPYLKTSAEILFRISGKFLRNFSAEIPNVTIKGNKHMKTVTSIIYRAFAAFALACFTVVPRAQAVSPAPDGCYPAYTTAEGCGSLNLLTTGAGNTGLGWYSLYSDSTGSYNTGVGAGALLLNNGDSNTAVGAVALLLNTTGAQNTAVGTDALVYNATGHDNTAIGFEALFSNTGGTEPAGSYNTAIGSQALYSNTTGNFNTASGFTALGANTTGFFNTATGLNALGFNTTGDRNTATGYVALQSNTTGRFNTADGEGALSFSTTGDRNTATGHVALLFNTIGTDNTADGDNALRNNTAGSGNIALGTSAGCNLTSGDNNIVIGNVGATTESNTIRIGTVTAEMNCASVTQPAHTATYIAGIFGATASGGSAVYITSDGHLGTSPSSARFKTAIKPMDESSEAILALKPVTFRYKHEIDPKGIPQFGLVAEEVEKVNPDLVSRDRDGRAYTVRYEAVNAMLLNEFLKERQKVQKLETTIAKQQKDFQATAMQQQKQIEALTAGLQKVSAQVEMSHPASQMVDNRP